MTDTQVICRKMREMTETSPLARIDYIAIADPKALEDLPNIPPIAKSHAATNSPRAVALLAVRFGSTRLIDNALLM